MPVFALSYCTAVTVLPPLTPYSHYFSLPSPYIPHSWEMGKWEKVMEGGREGGPGESTQGLSVRKAVSAQAPSHDRAISAGGGGGRIRLPWCLPSLVWSQLPWCLPPLVCMSLFLLVRA